MTYFLFICIVVSLIIIYALISTKSSIHLYYVIPVTMASAVGLYFYFDTVLGYPTAKLKSLPFQLISYASTNEEYLYMWVVHDNETEPIAYQIDYTEKRHKKLEAAMQRKGQGITQQGFFNEEFLDGDAGAVDPGSTSAGLGTSKSSEGLFEIHDMDHKRYLPPKEYDGPGIEGVEDSEPWL